MRISPQGQWWCSQEHGWRQLEAQLCRTSSPSQRHATHFSEVAYVTTTANSVTEHVSAGCWESCTGKMLGYVRASRLAIDPEKQAIHQALQRRYYLLKWPSIQQLA